MSDRTYSNSDWVLRTVAGFTPADSAASTQLMNSHAGGSGYTVTSLSVIVETSIVSPDNSVVVKARRLVAGTGTSGAVEIGSVTIPDGATQGSVYRLNLEADIPPGETVSVYIDTPAAGAGVDGRLEAVVEGYTWPHRATKEGVEKSVDGAIGKVYLVES